MAKWGGGGAVLCLQGDFNAVSDTDGTDCSHMLGSVESDIANDNTK